MFVPLCHDLIEETLHIAVNTPQLLEVPKKLRPAVLHLLRDQLQKYVMGQLSGTTDDVELMSHRQVEANQFRSKVLREVSEILETETKKEAMSYANGFEYRMQRGRRRVFSEVDPFDETTAKPSFEEPESFLSESQRQYEEKRMKLNREFFDSLQSGKKKEVVASDSEESDDVYCNLSELMKDNDPSIRRYDFGLENELMKDPVLSEWFFGDDALDTENSNAQGLDLKIDEERSASDGERGEEESGGKEIYSLVDDSSQVSRKGVEVHREVPFGEEVDHAMEASVPASLELGGMESSRVDSVNGSSAVDKVLVGADSGDVNSGITSSAIASSGIAISNNANSGIAISNNANSNNTISSNANSNNTISSNANSNNIISSNANSNNTISNNTTTTPQREAAEESDDDAIVVCTSSDGSIRVSHSSSFWRESKPSSKPVITSFTEAVCTDPMDEKRKEEEAARQALFSRLVNLDQNALHERKQDLLKKYRHFSSQNAFVSEDIIVDTTEILRIFGIPFLFAPGEAEAQCAFLEMMGLVDGVISNDSDVFAFGGKHLYRNFFADNQYVQAYRIEDMERELGLTRERIIEFALLEGCDYCDVRKSLLFNGRDWTIWEPLWLSNWYPSFRPWRSCRRAKGSNHWDDGFLVEFTTDV